MSDTVDSVISPTVQLARELMQKPSITPQDHGCQQLIANRLSKIGFAIEHMPFAEVENLWARWGQSDPLFVFAGHTDVVPTGDETSWTYPPFSATIVQDTLYARGAADMKGSIASMTTAVERYLKQHDPAGSIAFLLTSDEEGPAVNGTAKVIETLKSRDEQITWCIVGEPSSTSMLGDVIRNGRRGSVNGTLKLKGKQGHVAYPHLAVNPVHRALAALDALCQETWDQGNRFFPATSFQISNIHAGTGAANVVPGELNVMFNLRFSNDITVETIQNKVDQILNLHNLDFEISWSLSGMPFITEPGDLIQATSDALNRICAIEPQLDTGGGTSDGRFIAPTGAQVVELGPCNASIHQIDENVSIRELENLSLVYEQILCNLMGESRVNPSVA